MNGEQTVGTIIMLLCSWGCAVLFYLIGRFADRSRKPVHFWAGTKIDPRRISDVEAYNHANAAMWKLYSVPYWLAGVLSCFGLLSEVFIIAGMVMLFLACVPGIPLLIREYKQIERIYVSAKTGC
ncbi:MAG: hypothetical protein IKT52_07080 [Oscillospiraceae bacterium]|nr:hypothetical protein [Oscillospiraceae bacterium]